MFRKHTTDAHAADYELHSQNEGIAVAPLARAKSMGRTIAVAAALCLVLSACETMQKSMDKVKEINPFKGEKTVSDTTANAADVNTNDMGDPRKGAVTESGIGALSNSDVGYYMDQQEHKLRAQLNGSGVSVTRTGETIILSMPGSATFATNSSDVSANFYPVLDSVGHVLNEYEQTYVDVIGHTDSRGSAQYNQRLSERRAGSVARYLENRKVVPQRIEARGMGETSPVAPNDTKDSRALNRRVEIKLAPVT